MKIVYLIGNGFDLNLGLKTGYYHFYKRYVRQKSKNDTIKNFKQKLKDYLNGKDKKWSDFESAFGEYAEEFGNNEDEYLNLYDDVVNSLTKYIKSQNKMFEITPKDDAKLKSDLFNFEKYLPKYNRNYFSELKNKFTQTTHYVNVITFNYTQTFENIFQFNYKQRVISYRGNYANVLNDVFHIHGTIDENPVLGVYEDTQIKNMTLQRKKRIVDSIVKSKIYSNLGHMLDLDGFKLIKEANVICVFGMSFGLTDKGWWEAIVNKLATSEVKLVVFGKTNKTYGVQKFRNETEKDALKEHILSYKQINEREKERIKQNIIVCFDSEIFKLTNGSKAIVKKTNKDVKI